jgi:hypothetical protein
MFTRDKPIQKSCLLDNNKTSIVVFTSNVLPVARIPYFHLRQLSNVCILRLVGESALSLVPSFFPVLESRPLRQVRTTIAKALVLGSDGAAPAVQVRTVKRIALACKEI